MGGGWVVLRSGTSKRHGTANWQELAIPSIVRRLRGIVRNGKWFACLQLGSRGLDSSKSPAAKQTKKLMVRGEIQRNMAQELCRRNSSLGARRRHFRQGQNFALVCSFPLYFGGVRPEVTDGWPVIQELRKN